MKQKEEKKQNIRQTYNSTKYMFGFVWNGGKAYIFLKCIMAIINAVFPLSYTLMPGFIINELTKEQRLNYIIIYVGILLITPLVNNFINLFANRYISKLGMELNLKFEAEYFRHTLGMDLEHLETPEVKQLNYRAMDTYTNTLEIIEKLSALITAVLSVIALSALIMTLNPVIIILIVIIIYVNSLVTKRANYKQHLLDKEKSLYDRFLFGMTWSLREGDFGCKEIRLLNLTEMFINIVVDKKRIVNKLNLKGILNNNKASAFHFITNLIQELVLYAYLIYLVIQRGLAVGSLTIYLSAVGRLANSLNQVMQSYLELAKISLNVRDFKKFMEIPLSYQVSGDKIPVFGKDSVIEFKNVSFKYPNSENYALKNMNIKIRGDEKLCIVGANGSGKSTFIKLLTRFYKPTEGEILFNGVNVNEYDFIKYQELFSPVFQDFALYYMTLGENIVLDKEYDEEHLKRVGARSGLTPLLDKLPSGYKSHLWSMNQYDEENSFAPSGGEGQRIAIARAVYHDSLIYLLDEPTAALDPIAEYEIYMQFNEMTANKTAVLITHRLSAVQLADKVAVFDNGGLIEYGTHKQLYEKNGVYAEMFNKQAQFYIDEK